MNKLNFSKKITAQEIADLDLAIAQSTLPQVVKDVILNKRTTKNKMDNLLVKKKEPFSEEKYRRIRERFNLFCSNLLYAACTGEPAPFIFKEK